MCARVGNALLGISVVIFLGCSIHGGGLPHAREPQVAAADVACDALVALEPARRAAEASGDSDSATRIATATHELLMLLDSEDSERALRRLLDLAYFNLGAASTEVYNCIVVRKGSAVAPLIEREMTKTSSPCEAEFGSASQICRSRDATAAMLRFLVSQIDSGQSCELAR
jgi:hypothetical protein